jgi:nitrogen regulatory protein PII-like uncharacterized protein
MREVGHLGDLEIQGRTINVLTETGIYYMYYNNQAHVRVHWQGFVKTELTSVIHKKWKIS